MRMEKPTPAQKVTASTVAAAVVQLTVGIANTYILETEIPSTIETSLTILAVFLTGYLVPPARRDQVVESKVNADTKQNNT